jgi:hypothetical protein
MAGGDTISGSVNIQKIQDDVLKLWSVVKSQPGISQEQKNRIKGLYEGVVRSSSHSRRSKEPPFFIPVPAPSDFWRHVCLC